MRVGSKAQEHWFQMRMVADGLPPDWRVGKDIGGTEDKRLFALETVSVNRQEGKKGQWRDAGLTSPRR